MERFRNYYDILGLTRAASDLEIAQAYRAQLQKLQATSDASTSDRLKHLEEAYRTLTHPPSRKKHDEEVAWHATRRDLQSQEAMRQAWRQKEEKELAEDLARAAREAAEAAAVAAQLKAEDEARRQEEQARIDALAAARFRPVNGLRSVPQEDFAETVPGETPEPPAALPAAATRSVAIWAIAGSVLFVLVCFAAYMLLRPAAPRKPPAALELAAAPALAPASAPQAPASEVVPAAPVASAPEPAKATKTEPPRKADTAKSEDVRQYQKTLQRVEREHPELNADNPRRRDDLIAFVASRVGVHMREGYSRAKALEIAVRDMETQEQTRRLIDSVKTEKAKPIPESPPAPLDPGGHAGFDPKCRWVTPEQWSCK